MNKTINKILLKNDLIFNKKRGIMNSYTSLFFIYEQFYKNDAQIWPKIERSRLGFGNIHAKFAFLIITFYHFPQT